MASNTKAAKAAIVENTKAAVSEATEKARESVKGSADAFRQASEAASTALPHAEIPEGVRLMAEKSVKQTRSAYETMRSAGEQASEVFEESCGAVARGAGELGLKVMEAARSHANAGFDFAGELLAVRTPGQIVELQAAFARRQFETLSAQAREITAITNQLMMDSARPYRAFSERAAKFTQV
jgi:phasin